MSADLATADPSVRPPDPGERERARRAVRACLVALRRAGSARATALRLTIEEQVLLPALRAQHAAGADDPRLDAGLAALRARDDADAHTDEDGGAADAGPRPPTASSSATRHFAAVEALIDHPGVDLVAVGREIEALLARWRAEIATTGDIEDEDADPVGRPPR